MQKTITRGEEFLIGWRFKWPDGSPKDLTNFNYRIQIRPFERSSTVIASWANGATEVNFLPAQGAIDLVIPPSTTSEFDFKRAVIDCWVVNASDTDGDRSPITDLILANGVSR